jgi:hypothetical protein
VPEANSYLTCGSFMRPQCVSLFLVIIENYDIGVHYTHDCQQLAAAGWLRLRASRSLLAPSPSQ